MEVVISMFLLKSAISPESCIKPGKGGAQSYPSESAVYIYPIPTNWLVPPTGIIDLWLSLFQQNYLVYNIHNCPHNKFLCIKAR